MTDFYRDDQTKAAQSVLARLQKIVPEAVILGGWAVFLYTHGQRSTDVDIAVDFPSFGRLQQDFGSLITKNNNLRKYELILDRVEIDILVVHFSNAGIPIEALIEPTRSLSGFRVMSPEGLLAMKLCAWIDRTGRPKGDKDEADVLSLLSVIPMDWGHYREILTKAEAKYRKLLPGVIARVVSSAEVRQNWRFMKVNGKAVVTNREQWKKLKSDLVVKVPKGI